MSLHPFESLTPDFILNAVETTGLWPDARIYPLNSYENRVYQVGIEDDPAVIVKFYRPNRWNSTQLLEEHNTLLRLQTAGVKVVAPRVFDGKSLLQHGAFQFCIYDKIQGQSPDADNLDHLFATGEIIGQLHQAMAQNDFVSRAILAPIDEIKQASQSLLVSDLLAKDFKPRYQRICNELLQKCTATMALYWPKTLVPIHGDCHRSNILVKDNELYLLDFDDCKMGVAIQDIWLHLSGDIQQQKQQLSELIEGYESYYDFDRQQLPLIDVLKAYRLIQYSAWLLARWADPAFPRAFPWFASEDYWINHLKQLEECLLQWGQLSQ